MGTTAQTVGLAPVSPAAAPLRERPGKMAGADSLWAFQKSQGPTSAPPAARPRKMAGF